MIILNLTQHVGTVEQMVIEPANKETVQNLLTFSSLPTSKELEQRAKALAVIAKSSKVEAAMIGGAPYFMSYLERALRDVKISPLYAFTQRVSIDKKMDDGSVQKTAVFKHLGFVEAA